MSNNNSLVKKSFKDYGTMFLRLLPILIIVLAFGAIATALGFLNYTALIITLPFLFIPFFFGLHITVIYLKKHEGVARFSSYLKFVGSYFMGRYFGSYRVTFNLIISMLLSYFVLMIGLSIALSILRANDPSFVATLEEAMLALSDGDYDALTNLLNEQSSFSYFYYGGSLASTASTFILATYFILKETLNVEFRRRITDPLGSMGSRLVRKAFQNRHRDYKKSFNLAVLSIFSFTLLGYALGVIITYYAYQGSSVYYLCNFCVSGGVAGALAFLTLGSPVFFLYCYHLTENKNEDIKKTTYDLAQSALEQAEMQRKINEEFINKMRENMDEQEKKDDPNIIDNEDDKK